MQKKHTFFILLLTIAVFHFSCRKELQKPSWDVDILAPLLTSSLSIGNLIPDSLLVANPDSSLKIVYQNPIYNFNLDSMLEVPDTSLVDSYSIPFGSLFLNPGQELINNSEETSYSFNDAALTYCIIKNGSCNFQVSSGIKELTDFTYKIPKATKNNQPFEITVTVPAGTVDGPGIYNGSFDLTGYTIDLKGLSGNKVNTLYTSVVARVSPNGNSVVVVPGEVLSITNSFTDISLYYAKGYFGNNKFPVGPEQAGFSLFNKVVDGTLQLENVNLNLAVSNGIGVDARFLINNLTSVNTRTNTTVSLNHAIIGTPTNINRAIDYLFQPVEVSPAYFSVALNNSNSNIKAFLENLPNKIEYELETETNPYGNLSGGNDFINCNYGLNVNLDLEIPLSLIAGNLTLLDTVEFDGSAITYIDKIRDGTLILFADNGFPFDATVQLFLMDEQSAIIDSLFSYNTIASAPVNANFKVENKKLTKLLLPVSENKMSQVALAKKMQIKVSFTTNPTNQLLKIYSGYSIDFKLVGDFNYIIQP